jgi:hypothetical protein
MALPEKPRLERGLAILQNLECLWEIRQETRLTPTFHKQSLPGLFLKSAYLGLTFILLSLSSVDTRPGDISPL